MDAEAQAIIEAAEQKKRDEDFQKQLGEPESNWSEGV